jgi:hypothetical protein
MATKIVYPDGKVTVTVPATESIAVYTKGSATVSRSLGYPNVPSVVSVLGSVDGVQTIFGPYTSGATIIVEAGASVVEYAVGVGPSTDSALQAKLQGAPGVLNATGTLTAAMIIAGIVTSTTAAAVAATLDTGAIMDAALDMAIGESFDWSAIATGANAFTVTAAASGHTLVGSGVVATVTSGHFRTRKTAADTFVTYRLS